MSHEAPGPPRRLRTNGSLGDIAYGATSSCARRTHEDTAASILALFPKRQQRLASRRGTTPHSEATTRHMASHSTGDGPRCPVCTTRTVRPSLRCSCWLPCTCQTTPDCVVYLQPM